MIHSNILNLIGHPPLMEHRHSPVPGVRRFAQLAHFTPSGSLKDRIVRYILEKARETGELTPDKTVVDASSGNTGIAMGLIATAMGYRSRVYMPVTKSRERRIMMNFYGVELILTAGDNPHSHIHACEEIVARHPDRFFYLNQNGNLNNVWAHYHGTGAEILDQMGDLPIDQFVAGIGTGGVLMGVGRKLKERHPGARIVCMDPTQGISRIEGLLHLDGSYTPPIWDASVIDEYVHCSDEDAFAHTRRLAVEEGIFAGVSSGACYWAALQLAKRAGRGNILFVCGDRGERYLSTPMCAGMDEGKQE